MSYPSAHLAVDAGTGPVVVLLHAFPLDHRLWLPTVQALSGSFRVLVPDLPGFGRARPGTAAVERIHMGEMADAVVALLDGAELRPALVAGCSMGGYVALALAQRRPDLVPALAMVDSRARADLDAEREGRMALIATLQREAERAPHALALAMLPRLLGPAVAPEVRETVRGWIHDSSPAGAIGALAGMAVRPGRESLVAGFAGPLLAVCGAEDAITGRHEVEAMARAAPCGTSAVIAGAGHLPPVETPREFSAVLGAFARMVAGRAARS